MLTLTGPPIYVARCPAAPLAVRSIVALCPTTRKSGLVRPMSMLSVIRAGVIGVAAVALPGFVRLRDVAGAPVADADDRPAGASGPPEERIDAPALRTARARRKASR